MKQLFTFLALFSMSLSASLMAQRTGYNCPNGVSLADCEHSVEIYTSVIPTDIGVNSIPAKSGGTGTADDPYIISTAEEFNEMATRLTEGSEAQSSIFPNGNSGYAGQYFKLANDIELTEFIQVGDYEHIFFGNFDGDNHSIKGIDGYTEECAGLFNRLGDGASVTNLSIYGKIEGVIYVGGLAGVLMTGSRVSNIHNFVEVTSEYYYAGGITGSSWGAIESCTNNANINGSNEFVGGIVGDCYFDVYDCVNTGDVTGLGSTGGVIGYSFPHNVARCVNAGNIYGASYYTGGVIGFVDNYNYPDLICSNLINVGEIITGSASVIGRLWVEGDLEGHADNCFFNQQNSTMPGYVPGTHEYWVQGKNVIDMTGEELSEYLEGWTFNEGLFPIPATLTDAQTALCAATPAYFYNEDDNVNIYNNLDKDFYVNIDNEGEWVTDSDIITIEDGVATLNEIGNCVMTFYLGDASKRYNLTVSQPDFIGETMIETNNVYPNPAHSYVTIENETAKNIKIFNVNGQCMMDINVDNPSTQIDISNLESGLYIISVECNDGIINSRLTVTR